MLQSPVSQSNYRVDLFITYICAKSFSLFENSEGIANWHSVTLGGSLGQQSYCSISVLQWPQLCKLSPCSVSTAECDTASSQAGTTENLQSYPL